MWLTVVAGSFQCSSVLQGQGADCAVTQRGASELSGFWPEMEGKKERWGREQMKSRSLFSWFPPCWVASDSRIPLLLTLALLKTVVNLIPLYFRVLGKEADRTGNSLAVVLSQMVSLNLTLVNNVSINKLLKVSDFFFFFTVILANIETYQVHFQELELELTHQGKWVLEVDERNSHVEIPFERQAWSMNL